MAPVQRGLYLSGQPLDHEPSLGQVPVVSLAPGSPPGSDAAAAAWLPPSHQFSARLRYGAPPMPPPPPQSPGSLAAVMHGLPPLPPVPASGLGAPPYPGDMNCDASADVLQYQAAPGSTQNAGAAGGGRVEVF